MGGGGGQALCVIWREEGEKGGSQEVKGKWVGQGKSSAEGTGSAGEPVTELSSAPKDQWARGPSPTQTPWPPVFQEVLSQRHSIPHGRSAPP